MTAPDATPTETHRAQQVALTAAFLIELVRLWPLLDPLRLDKTMSAWLGLGIELILRYRSDSVTLASRYYDRIRTIETGVPLPSRSHFVDLMSPPNVDAIRASLYVTGPASIQRRLERGVDPVQAERTALVDVSGAATRHVLDGSRDFITTAVTNDELAVGWARVTGPNPCAFCAMLASRGPVYKSKETALGDVPYHQSVDGHNHCQCTAEPSFSRSQGWPGRAREFEQLWKDATKGESDQLNAFRRAYEQQQDRLPIPVQRTS